VALIRRYDSHVIAIGRDEYLLGCLYARRNLYFDGSRTVCVDHITKITAVRLSEEETQENPLVSVASGEKWTVST